MRDEEGTLHLEIAAGPGFPLSGAFQPPNPRVSPPSVSSLSPLSFHWSAPPTCSPGLRRLDWAPGRCAGLHLPPGALSSPALQALAGQAGGERCRLAPGFPGSWRWGLCPEGGHWEPGWGWGTASAGKCAGFHSGARVELPRAPGGPAPPLPKTLRGDPPETTCVEARSPWNNPW